MRIPRGHGATARAVIVAAALAVTTAALGACGSGTSHTQALSGVVLDPPLRVGDQRLPEGVEERPFAFVAPPGGLLAVYFGYTSCPDLCPTTMADLKVAIGDLGPDASRVDVAMVTVDPSRDTAEVLADYLGHFFTRGAHAVRTGDWNALRAVEAAFLASSTISHDSHGTSVSHTASTSVVDAKGTVVVQWPFGTPPKTMAQDLRVLLARDDRAST